MQLEENVSLSGNGATFSLSSDDQRLFDCVNGMTDRSCYLYSPSDLTVPPVATGVSIVGSGGVTATSFQLREASMWEVMKLWSPTVQWGGWNSVSIYMEMVRVHP